MIKDRRLIKRSWVRDWSSVVENRYEIPELRYHKSFSTVQTLTARKKTGVKCKTLGEVEYKNLLRLPVLYISELFRLEFIRDFEGTKTVTIPERYKHISSVLLLTGGER